MVGIVGMPAVGMPVGLGRYGRALENPNSPRPTVDGRWAPPRCPWTGDIAVYSIVLETIQIIYLILLPTAGVSHICFLLALSTFLLTSRYKYLVFP